MWLLFPDHCPLSPICLEWSSLSPSWKLAWTKVSKKLRRVEFGGEIGAILQQSRVLLDNLQYKVTIIIMRMRNETAHAQYTIMDVRDLC